MAFTPVTPISINPTLFGNKAQFLDCNFLQGDGVTPLDVSGWFSVTLELNADINGIPLPLGTLAKLPTFSTPTCRFTLAAADMMTLVNSKEFSGAVPISIYGKPVTGDDQQVIATGTAFLSWVS
jgi:hypothetical protein